MATIAIVGAGFSGTLLALHLLRRCPVSTTVVLIESNSQFGLGTAYATGNPNHLLNVAAGRMSAFHDRPDDFLEWLQGGQNEAPALRDCSAGTYAPRGAYGAYIRDLLNREIGHDAQERRLKLLRGRVLAVEETAQGVALRLDRGRQFAADLVVVATGHFPPEAPADIPSTLVSTGLYRPDPWDPDAWAELDPEATVLTIGTGLTMVDSVISLLDQGHRGPIHAVSRRGLLPTRHADSTAPAPPRPERFPTQLMPLMRCLRSHGDAASASRLPWQPIVDSIRPFTQDLWLALSDAERARFLRHLRPWWDIHRHRMAPEVAARIEACRRSGQLQLHAGRIGRIDPGGCEARVHFARRFSGAPVALDVARIVNCSGPGCDFDRVTDPLMRYLLDNGLARPDPLRLGLDVTVSGAVKNGEGAISGRLFAVGPLTKGMFWEIIAVPDIRRQCERMATSIALLV
jgi:uncharacterized NAD(P)/FAD-binding protein YdhS